MSINKEQNNSGTDKNFGLRLIFTIIFFTAVTVILMLYSAATSRGIAQRYYPLVHADMKIKLEGSMAHLWFEEAISGDKSLTIKQFLTHIDQAQWYAEALINGGITQKGPFSPVKDPELLEFLDDTVEYIHEFRDIARQRWANKLISGIGSDSDQKFDEVYSKFLASADQIEDRIYEIIDSQLEIYHWQQGAIILAVIIAGFGSILVLTHYERQRTRADRELSEARTRLSHIINYMPSILIGLDQNCGITQWNIEAENDSGFTHDHALGRRLDELIPRLAPILPRIKHAVYSLTQHTETISTRTEDGSTRTESITLYPIIAEESRGAVLIMEDITERMNLQQVLVQSEKMMSVGGLAAGMAHEINNPLAGILGYVQNMRKRIFGDLQKNASVADDCGVELEKVRAYLNCREIPRMIDGINDAGTRAAAIVGNMLSFSRKSSRQHDYHDPIQLLNRTIDLAASDYNLDKYYDFKQIKILRDYAPEVPGVFCDGSEVQQVLLNLLKNGAEAMSEKEYKDDLPTFTCRIRSYSGNIVFEIEDNGPGMDTEVQARVFEPFFTTKGVGKGTGLGLSVSYFIITEQHKGSMEVQSIPHRWTRFRITLPLHPDHNDDISPHPWQKSC